MDYAGQRLAERVGLYIMSAFACAGFAYGYRVGSYRAMLALFASGCVVAIAVTGPAWGVYRRNPVRWTTTQAIKAER